MKKINIQDVHRYYSFTNERETLEFVKNRLRASTEYLLLSLDKSSSYEIMENVFSVIYAAMNCAFFKGVSILDMEQYSLAYYKSSLTKICKTRKEAVVTASRTESRVEIVRCKYKYIVRFVATGLIVPSYLYKKSKEFLT